MPISRRERNTRSLQSVSLAEKDIMAIARGIGAFLNIEK
jgi:hypothetical protein